MKPATEPDTSSSRSRNLSYLPDLNVFLLELVGKDRGPEIWSYRLKKGPKPAKVPTDLEVVTEIGKATLTWKSGEKQKVYRAQAEKAWEAKFAAVGEGAGRYEDGGLEAGKTYFYRVGSGAGRSFTVRTQPAVLVRPVVSALAADKIDVAWNAHPAKDILGYNVYRGVASVHTVKKGSPGAWKDNDPEYAEPQIVSIKDIGDPVKLNDAPIAGTSFTDTKVDLAKKGPESGEYRHAVYAYIVRAVNKLGTESGPSPYALTIPSEPENVLARQKGGGAAELKWDASREKGIAGYLVYEIADQRIARITPEPVKAGPFNVTPGGNQKRYCVVAVDALGQEGQPSSSAWVNHSYKGFFGGEFHQ